MTQYEKLRQIEVDVAMYAYSSSTIAKVSPSQILPMYGSFLPYCAGVCMPYAYYNMRIRMSP